MATNKSKPKFNIGDKAIFKGTLFDTKVNIIKRGYEETNNTWYYTVSDEDRYPFKATEDLLESIK